MEASQPGRILLIDDDPALGGYLTRVLTRGGLELLERVQLIAADMDPWAAGLYLTPERTLVPAGAASEFTAVLLDRCRTLGVDVVLPTVDAELLPLARAREEFAAAGVALLLAPAAALDVILTTAHLGRDDPASDSTSGTAWARHAPGV